MPRLSLSSSFGRLIIVAFCLLPLPGLGQAAAQPQSGAPAATHTVFLPVVRGQGSLPSPSPSPSPSPEPSPEPEPPANSALFLQALEGRKIAGAQIKADAQGGVHIAYYDAVPLAEGPGATYGYCPPPAAQCAEPARWSFTPPIGDMVDEVQLQLTPEGRPRMVIGFHVTSHNREVYLYAECDSNCAAAEESWAFVAIGQRALTTFSPGGSNQPKRSFALDAQGRPGFVLLDDDYIPEPDHAGGYYISCQANCAFPERWSEARFTNRDRGFNELIGQPVLQYAPDGAPVILAELYPLAGAGEPGIYYFRCGQGCAQAGPEGWERVRIAERTSGAQPSWDLELDAQGRPRVVYFKYLSSQDTTRSLFYLWCDEACLSAESWQITGVGLPDEEGIGADLELDAQGRPRVAFLSSTALGYAWCDGACATSAGWQRRSADSDEQMTQDYPVPLPTTCRAGIWDGYAPSLSLDGAGAPLMAYDASYRASCQYVDPENPGQPPRDEFVELWHAVRVVLAP